MCRRRLRRLNLVALVFPVAVWGCAQPEPPGRWEGARAVLDRSLRELQDEDPAAARHLEGLVSEAERVTAAERAALPWNRQPGRVEAAWGRAVEAARRRMAELRRTRAERRQSLEGLLREATARVQVARGRRGRSGMTEGQAALLAAAEFRLAAARRLAAEGDLRTALVQAAAALQYGERLDAAWEAVHERFSDPGLLREWRRQAELTVAESRRRHGVAIVVDKLHRRLLVYRAGVRVADLEVELGSGGLERKRFAGDRATPEGQYRIKQKKSGGATRYHLALLIDYPNAQDRRRYRTEVEAGEVPRGVGLGGLIEIHGGGGTGRDWTDGCVALEDGDMDRLFPLVEVGTPVTIVGAL